MSRKTRLAAVATLILLSGVAAFARVAETASSSDRPSVAPGSGSRPRRVVAVQVEARAKALAQELGEREGRFETLGELARLGRGGSVAVEAIADVMVSDEDAEIRDRAAAVLAQMGAPAAAALVSVLRSTPEARPLAAKALGRMEAEAVHALIEALEDIDPEVRRIAADVLGSVGPAAAPAIGVLEQALEDKDVLVGLAAHGALQAIGS